MSLPWRHAWRWVGPALLAGILWRVGPTAWWRSVREASPIWFLVACAWTLPGTVIRAWRWRRILGALGHALPLGSSVRIHAAGSLAGAVTPGKVGDVAKAAFLPALGVPVGVGVTASLLDRALDVLGLLVAAAAAALLLPGLPSSVLVVLVAWAAVLMLAVAALVRGPPGGGASRASGAGEAGGRERIARVRETLWREWRRLSRALRRAGVVTWAALLLATALSWATYVASVACCARSLEVEVGAAELVLAVSLAAAMSALPITVAGIGTRDAVYVVALSASGVAAHRAVGLSSLVLAWTLVNALLFWLLSPGPRTLARRA